MITSLNSKKGKCVKEPVKINHKQISCLIDEDMQVSWANYKVLRYKTHAIPNYLNA